MAVAFDTLKAATRLREEAGFDERRVLVASFAEGIGESLSTKEDLENTETALRKDLESTETALRGEIGVLRKDMENLETAMLGRMRELEQRMTVRLGAMIAAAAGIAVVLIKLLP